MFSRGDKEFVIDMFLSCQKILEYTKGMNFKEFEKDQKTIDAVVRNIEILGEAVKNISQGFREKYINVEWSEIARTRDKLIHFYFGIDKEVIWDIVNVDIPKLFEKLRQILKEENWENELD